jgi:hypothetical protein
VQTITVLAPEDVDIYVTVVLEYVPASDDPNEALERCIHFVPRAGLECGAPLDVPVLFTGDPATGDVVLTVPPGTWTSICAKDEQHTLFDNVDLALDGDSYVAASPLVLIAGDTDNSNVVDMLDVTLFLAQFQYGLASVDGGCPWDENLRDADFNDDHTIGSDDFTYLSANWLESSLCLCETAGVWPPDTIATRPAIAVRTSALPVPIAQAADLNRDGVVDFRDVRLFERRHNLPSSLSDVIERTTPRSAPMEAAR